MKLLTDAGIYAITHTDTGRRYIGSAVNVARRWSQHKHDLSRGRHGNSRLQNGYAKHGAEAYKFSLLEAVDDAAALIVREQLWIDTENPFYNICRTAGSKLGFKHSAETRRRMSEAQKARPAPSTETRAKASASGKARPPFTAETRANISAAAKKRPPRPPHSAETLARMSAAQKGRKRGPFSAEHKASLSASSRQGWSSIMEASQCAY